ncbi:Co-chaperone protein HscB homolog [Gammaproteobacteria bacterium]
MLDFSQNHFELFGLAVGFDMDSDRLAERYRDLQRVLHPDRFSQAGAAERRLSMQRSMQVNEAFETLRDPLARTLYLLSLKGLTVDTATSRDNDFLMDQMTLREALVEAQGQPDAMVAVAAVGGDVRYRLDSLLGQLTHCFNNGDEKALEEARSLACKLQFLTQFRLAVDQAEAALEEDI